MRSSTFAKGATLARNLPASGHEVKLANSKRPDTIRDLARDIGATAVPKEEAVSVTLGVSSLGPTPIARN